MGAPGYNAAGAILRDMGRANDGVAGQGVELQADARKVAAL